MGRDAVAQVREMGPDTATASDKKESSGHPHTAESRAKISAANKGKTPWNQGLKHSEETRARIAEGTRRAMLRKAQERKEAQERLRHEQPEEYAKLVAAKAAMVVAKAKVAEERRLEREVKKAAATKAAAAARREMRSQNRSLRRARVSTGSGGRVNFTFTDEQKARISASLKARWADPEYRARQKKKASMSEEARKRLSETMRAKWADGDYRSRVTANGSHTAERRAKIAASVKAKWADPEYRARTTSAIRKAHNNETRKANARNTTATAAQRQKISHSMKKLWQDPEYRTRQLTKMDERSDKVTSQTRRKATPPRKATKPAGGRNAAGSRAARSVAVDAFGVAAAGGGSGPSFEEYEQDDGLFGEGEVAEAADEAEEADSIMAWGDTIIELAD